jgi:hypothetical protein
VDTPSLSKVRTPCGKAEFGLVGRNTVARFRAHGDRPLNPDAGFAAHRARHRRRATRRIHRQLVSAAIQVQKRIAIRPPILGREPGLVTTPKDKAEMLLGLVNVGDGSDVDDPPLTLGIDEGQLPAFPEHAHDPSADLRDQDQGQRAVVDPPGIPAAERRGMNLGPGLG